MDHKDCINALNDLIQINNDRISGYERAIKELPTGESLDLKDLFNSMIAESRTHSNELAEMVDSYGGKTAEGSTITGKLYRAWMDVKALFGGSERETIINNCLHGEEAALKAYEMALDDDDVMNQTKALISRQKTELMGSQTRIRALAGMNG